jgi:hypothetical protein
MLNELRDELGYLAERSTEENPLDFAAESAESDLPHEFPPISG